jgi:hypothetical protein
MKNGLYGLSIAGALLVCGSLPAKAGRVTAFYTYACEENWGDETWSLMRSTWVRDQRPGATTDRIMAEVELANYETKQECEKALAGPKPKPPPLAARDAESCIDVSGKYQYAGKSPQCSIQLGEAAVAYPVPFADSHDPLPGTIPAGATLDLKQVGCEAIHVQFRDATGDLASKTISLRPKPEKHGRISFKKQAIFWREREAYRDHEPEQGLLADYRVSASFKFSFPDPGELRLESRYQRSEWIVGWPMPHEDRMTVDCRLKRIE